MTLTPPAQRVVIPTPPPIDTCKTCRFWSSNDIEGDDGRCHWRPPTPPIQVGGHTIWPKTGSSDWCGQYVVRA